MILFWCRAATACTPQLPAEAAIPGERIAVVDRLPPEAMVPGERIDARSLPSEATLPPSSSRRSPNHIAPPVDPKQDDKVQDDSIKEFSKRPLLRILTEGPFAPVQSVCFSADSKRILAGGQDKALHAWRLLRRPDGAESWIYEKAIYWQIYRASRGQIFSVAAGENLIAFGGTGASASFGEIALVDPGSLEFSRALFDLEQGHLNPIHTIATNKSNSLIASIDFDGRTIAWHRNQATGKWSPEVLRSGDDQLFDRPTKDELAKWRSRGGGVAVSDSETITFPELSQKFQPGSVPTWQLVRVNSTGAKTVMDAPESHRGMVAAIASSADGNRIVSADIRGNGRLFVWDLSKSPLARVVSAKYPIRCIDISADGTRFAIGTARNDENVSQVVLFEWSKENTIREIARWSEEIDVVACALNADASRLAYTQANSINVRQVDSQAIEKLNSKIEQPYRVAFSAKKDDYRIAIRNRTNRRFQWCFDPNKLTMFQLKQDDPQSWMTSNPQQDKWKITATNDVNGLEVYAVAVDNKTICQLPLDSGRVGQITHYAFVADRTDPTVPSALIVGTSGECHIYVYRIDKASCRLVREYRWHTAPVLCVGISADKKYLVSASEDGTVGFWKTDGAFEEENVDRDLINRWGAEFEIRDDQLIVKNMVKDGPLYFRGIRDGDEIEQICWNASDEKQLTLNDPEEMLDRLKTATTATMIRFDYRRGGAEQPYFYLFPAWQPLASLVLDQNREWAFWTPYGYYDASFNGHRIFGWQINRGVNRQVEFFRAAELKEELERPKMMQNLLSQGSVDDAFQVANVELPNNLSERLSATGRLKPTVKIVRTEAGKQGSDSTTRLMAQVAIPEGVELGRVKAFANGVPAIRQSLVDQKTSGKQRIYDYLFEFKLPSDSRIKLQVLASSSLGHGAMAETLIDGWLEKPSRKPRMFVMSLGVSNYLDSQIPRLDFAHVNAETVLESLSGSQLSKEQTVLLTDAKANKSMWLVTSRSMAEEMKTMARPDDLLIVFLSGHGFRDPVTEEYFYLTANSKYSDVLSRRYADCISFDDLHSFADIPCRKLVILDTCHSGSLQVLRQQNLKSVVRTLENDLFFTLTASEGSQEAFESEQRGLGLFTSRLSDALAGQSDEAAAGGNGDGQVTLNEVIRFLKSTVPDDAAQLGSYQFPTASPADLLELVEIPLVSPNAMKQ